MSKRKLENAEKSLPIVKKQKLEHNKTNDNDNIRQIGHSNLHLLISGYVRQNKLILCICDIIEDYYPKLIVGTNSSYDWISQTIRINKFGRCFYDLKLDEGKYVMIVKSLDNDAEFSVGICSNANIKTEITNDEMFMSSSNSGTSYELYITKSCPIRFSHYLNGETEYDAYLLWNNKDLNIDTYQSKEYKFIIDCDKGEINCYWGQFLCSATTHETIINNFQLPNIKINKNETYYPFVETTPTGPDKIQISFDISKIKELN